MLTLVKEVPKFWYRCRRCDKRWSEYVNDAKVCPKCGGNARLYGLEIEKR